MQQGQVQAPRAAAPPRLHDFGRAEVNAAFAAALATEKPIAISSNLARLTGDPKAALFLSQLVYWTRVGTHVEHHGGWIFKTRDQWEAETALSRNEQQTARKLLLAQGLIQEARIGSPARLCFKVRIDMLGQALADMLQHSPVQLSLLDLRAKDDEARQFVRTLLGPTLAFYRAYTEITPNVTTAVFLAKALAVQRNVQLMQSKRGAQDTAQWTEDWWHLPAAQWHAEAGLSASQLRDAKQKMCRAGYLETATQTHPKNKQFMRLKLNKIALALSERFVSHMHEQSGMLGSVVRGLKRSESLAHIGELGAPHSVAQFGELSDRHSVPKNPELGAPHSVAHFGPLGDSSAVCQNPPSSYPLSAQLDGGFSHVSRQVLTPQAAAFSTSVGRISHLSRQDLARPRARAVLTTYITTTTTTSDAPVVVVVDQEIPKPKPNASENPVTQLVWPETLTERHACERIISSCPPDRRQLLIDELTGCLSTGRITSPVGYLRKLVSLDQSTPGGLILERAQAVADARARASAKPLLVHQTRATELAVTTGSGRSEAALQARAQLLVLRQQFISPLANASSQPTTSPAPDARPRSRVLASAAYPSKR